MNLNKIDSGDGMKIYMKSDATERQMEIARKMYPNAIIVRDDKSAKTINARDWNRIKKNSAKYMEEHNKNVRIDGDVVYIDNLCIDVENIIKQNKKEDK